MAFCSFKILIFSSAMALVGDPDRYQELLQAQPSLLGEDCLLPASALLRGWGKGGQEGFLVLGVALAELATAFAAQAISLLNPQGAGIQAVGGCLRLQPTSHPPPGPCHLRGSDHAASGGTSCVHR